MSTTDTFEQRAMSAGAALRAAFFEGDAMTAPTTHRPPSIEQPGQPRSRSRLLLAAAAVTATALAGAAIVATAGDDERALPPADRTPEQGQVLTGLLGVPQFPIRVKVPVGLEEVDQDAGSRAFSLTSGEQGGLFVTALRSVNGTPAGALPSDVTAALADRDDLVISAKATGEVAGRPAQAFTLGVASGQQARDVWCPVVEPACFKPVVGMPMDVLVVETEAEPLWIAAEYTEATRQTVQALLQELVEGIELTRALRIEVPGVSLAVPTGWRIDAQGARFAQAGNPTNRAAEGVNVVAPASVVAPDGTRSSTPADLAGWLRSRSGITTSVLQLVDVGPAEATLVRVDAADATETLWCGTSADSTDSSSCFDSGKTVLYLIIPTDAGPVVVERHTAAAAGELTGADLQQWANAHLELIPAITVGS